MPGRDFAHGLSALQEGSNVSRLELRQAARPRCHVSGIDPRLTRGDLHFNVALMLLLQWRQ